MYGSTMELTRYHGNGSYLICLAVLCVVVRIVGDMRLIYSCVTKGTNIISTLGGLPGFHFFVVCTLGAGFYCWSFLVR